MQSTGVKVIGVDGSMLVCVWQERETLHVSVPDGVQLPSTGAHVTVWYIHTKPSGCPASAVYQGNNGVFEMQKMLEHMKL